LLQDTHEISKLIKILIKLKCKKGKNRYLDLLSPDILIFLLN